MSRTGRPNLTNLGTQARTAQRIAPMLGCVSYEPAEDTEVHEHRRTGVVIAVVVTSMVVAVGMIAAVALR
jgi:hypothetical protein